MNNKKFYIAGISSAIILILMISYFVVAGKKQNKIAKQDQNQIIMSSSKDIANENKTNEVNTNQFNTINNEVKINNSISKNENKEISKTKKITNEKSVKTSSTQPNKEEKVIENKDPIFKYPVEGEIILDYAKEKLVFSNTLGEWITHLGIDIKADKTTVVKSSADGKIKSIKNDPRYGLTVVVEHNNGLSSVYSNLLTAEFVKIGEKVTQGQTLGTVGNTASFEILDESHLHFEILKDGNQIDPNLYLQK